MRFGICLIATKVGTFILFINRNVKVLCFSLFSLPSVRGWQFHLGLDLLESFKVLFAHFVVHLVEVPYWFSKRRNLHP